MTEKEDKLEKVLLRIIATCEYPEIEHPELVNQPKRLIAYIHQIANDALYERDPKWENLE
jgi:hypothetical protein